MSSGEEKAVRTEIVWSEDELEADMQGLELQEALDYVLPFGRHSGTSLGELILTRDNRSYLRYLCAWDNLRPETRARVNKALAHYDDMRKAAGLPPRKRAKKKKTKTTKKKKPAKKRKRDDDAPLVESS